MQESFKVKSNLTLDGSRSYYIENSSLIDTINFSEKLPRITNIDLINSNESIMIALTIINHKSKQYLENLLKLTKLDFEIYQPNGHVIYYIKNPLPALALLQDAYSSYSSECSALLKHVFINLLEEALNKQEPHWKHKLYIEKKLSLEYPKKETQKEYGMCFLLENTQECSSNSFLLNLYYYSDKDVARATRKTLFEFKRQNERNLFFSASEDERKKVFDEEIKKYFEAQIKFYLDFWSLTETEYRHKYAKVQEIKANGEIAFNYLSKRFPEFNIALYQEKLNNKIMSLINPDYDGIAKTAKYTSTFVGAVSDLSFAIGGLLFPQAERFVNAVKNILFYSISTTKVLSSGYSLGKSFVSKDDSNYRKIKEDLVKAFIWQATLCSPKKFLFLTDNEYELFLKLLMKIIDERYEVRDTYYLPIVTQEFSNETYISNLGFEKEWNTLISNKNHLTFGNLLELCEQQTCFDQILGSIETIEEVI